MMLRYALIDRLRGTSVLAHYRWLQSFHGNGSDLERRQTDLLRALLRVLQRNPFYGEWMKNASDRDIERVPRKLLSCFPVLTKQAAAEAFHQIHQSQPGRGAQRKQTGGSTGEPFRYWLDAESISFAWGFIFKSWNEYVGYQPGDPYVTVAGTSLGASAQNVRMRLYHGLQNNHVIPADHLAPGMPLPAGSVSRAKILYGYPSALCALLECAPGIKSRFGRLQAIVTTSEQLTPGTRQLLKDGFGVDVFDQYGANDGGLISCETRANDGFHYHPLNCLVETWRNEEGMEELLLTSLNSWTFPLVRYRVGDLGRAEQPGETEGVVFPRILNLQGRSRDILTLPSGRKVHGSAVNTAFYSVEGLARYRIIQSEDHHIRLAISSLPGADWSAVAESARIALGRALSETLSIQVEPLTHKAADNRKFKLIESRVH